MNTPGKPDRLIEIVKQRARELREGRRGYSEAVDTLADELYLSGRGKETRIGSMGATPVLIAPAVQIAVNAESLFAKTKKAKATAIGKIRTLISPWVSDVYEED